MIFNMMDNARRSKGLELAYTGTMTQSSITVDGAAYTLYTLTTSGTLTVVGRGKNIGVWICGGGANGGTGAANYNGSGTYPGCGGAGAYCTQYSGTLAEGTYTVQIAAQNGTSSFGTLLSTPAVSSKNGGTGGGYGGTGDGITKYPFGDTENFYPHCGGGGGGVADRYDTWSANGHSYVYGGNGGTNGSDGNSGSGYTGGEKGGGNGGTADGSSEYANKGKSATFYGSGGGGGGSWGSSQWTGSAVGGGSGYQGVMYIRVPA